MCVTPSLSHLEHRPGGACKSKAADYNVRRFCGRAQYHGQQLAQYLTVRLQGVWNKVYCTMTFAKIIHFVLTQSVKNIKGRKKKKRAFCPRGARVSVSVPFAPTNVSYCLSHGVHYPHHHSVWTVITLKTVVMYVLTTRAAVIFRVGKKLKFRCSDGIAQCAKTKMNPMRSVHSGPVLMNPVDRAGPVKGDLALPLLPL